MHITKLSQFQEFMSVRNEWNSLLERSNRNCVSLTHEWLCSWWEAFGDDADLWVLLLREREPLLGAAPLMLKHGRFRRLPARTLTLMVNGNSPQGEIVLANPDLDSAMCLLKFLNEAKREWDVLSLTKLPRDSETMNCLQNFLNDAGFLSIQTDSLNSPYIDTTQNWGTYYTSRSTKFRKVMRNKLNRVNRNGSISIERITDTESVKNALKEIFEVSAKSWKAHASLSIPDNPRVEVFYRKITDVMGEKEMVEIWLMRHNKEAIAFEYHIKHRGIVYPIRADFDERYRQLSPGSVLEYEILRALFEDPEVLGYNSCGDTYEYLMNWATEVIERVEILIFNSAMYSRNLFNLESKMVPLARRAKRLLNRQAAGASK